MNPTIACCMNQYSVVSSDYMLAYSISEKSASRIFPSVLPTSSPLSLLCLTFTLCSPHSSENLGDRLLCRGADKQKAGDRLSDGGLRCQTESGRQLGPQTSWRWASLPLTRPDSFHAGSCDSEREDRVRSRVFDVGVALVFEGTAFRLCLLFLKPCCVRRAELPGAGAGRNSQKLTMEAENKPT